MSASEQLLRDLSGPVLATVVRRFGDFAASEDAVQEALLAAATQWPSEGIPDNPRAWLTRVASRRMADHVRAELARRRRESSVALESEREQPAPELTCDDALAQDDTLMLLFMCCHASLTPSSAIALTLRAVAGLTTAEIASAFMVPEATMAQRISRAKQTIKKSGAGFSPPSPEEQPERLRAVLHVLYLMFNEGYASSSGERLLRVDVSAEAIRLARSVHRLAPEHAEVTGLLALMILTDARRPARTGPGGELVPLDEQDRTLWDREKILEGTALITEALHRGAVGPYQLQAAIAAVHDEAAHSKDTDWPQILALYGLLKRMGENPMVTLSHAIAAAMVHGPATGLTLIEPLDRDPHLSGHYRLDAVRAHLYEMAGEKERALSHYRAAAARTASLAERNYLIMRAARLSP
jgi:RNA polymerase sigma factor (sigma-70 family)